MQPIKAPYPQFGGKSGIMPAIWRRFGLVRNFVDPFCGSASSILGAPELPPVVTLNDLDGFIANFWRAVAADPDSVARFVDWPVNEIDLFARHVWLLKQEGALRAKLEADPDWFDAKIAGWWCWGACCWIGTGWCSGDGPHWIDEAGNRTRRQGGGVAAKLPHLGNAGRGVNRKLPYLGGRNAGQGVHRNDMNHRELCTTLPPA